MFYILEPQGRGGASSFERPGVRRDRNVVRAPMVKPHDEHVIIPLVLKEHVEANTLRTINALTQTLIHCMIPIVEEDPAMHHGHMCTSCESLCTFGSHARDCADNGLVTNPFVNEIFDIET